MKLVAITGSIGCGKTTLAKIARELGYAVYDLDAWVRRIYYNKDFLKKLKEVFPLSVREGVADKKYLRRIVFEDPKKLKQLENIIYPFLNIKIRKLINKKATKNYICFVDAALLFEKGWNKYCDFIILADVCYEVQKQRVMKRDGISEEEFNKINNIQLKNSEKKILSDIVVDTNKRINLLKVEMINIIEGLKKS